MDPNLFEFIKSDTPPLNPDTANGLAQKHMKKAEEFIDSVMRAVLKGLDGFKYVGYERVTPLEEFAELTRPRDNKRKYDIARSDTYMVRYLFDFKGKEYSKLISLPFVGEAGTLYIRGTKYTISPALVDRVISITPPNVFVRLLRDRLNFSKEPHHYLASVGQNPISKAYYEKRETVPVISSAVYKQTTKLKAREKIYGCDTVLVFYLLCKYGTTEMFRLFTNTEVKFVDVDTVNEDEYPSEEWVLCRSMGTKPKKLKKKIYEPSSIGIMIRRTDYTEINKHLIGGFFYVLDYFSEEMTIDELDSTVRWRVCMGMCLWGHEVNTGKLYDDLTDHINSLDNYIDEIMRIKFREIGFEIDNIYQLFFLIIEKFNTWQMEHINNESNLYSKELSILYYVLMDIIKQIVIFYFKMTKDARDGLTENDVQTNLMFKLRTQEILSLHKTHGEVSVVNSSGDNKIFRITQLLVPQSKTSKLTKSSTINLNDPVNRVHVSLAEVCTYLGMTKASPDGLTRLNLHLDISDTGTLYRNPELMKVLDEVQEILVQARMLEDVSAKVQSGN